MMDDKFLEDRLSILDCKNLSEMSFLESLAIKSMRKIFLDRKYYDGKNYGFYLEIIEILIETDEEKTRIKEMWIYDYSVRKSELLDLYINFEKKINAAIEEILNGHT